MRKSTTYAGQKLFCCLLAATVFVCAALTLAAQKKSAASGSSVFAQDKGKFTIQLNGQTVGHEDFDISPAAGGWTARGTTDIKPPDSTAERVTGTLT
jgi:hypothetical protein